MTKSNLDHADYTHTEPSNFPFGMQISLVIGVLSLVCGWQYLYGTGNIMWLQLGYWLAVITVVGVVATMFMRGTSAPESRATFNAGWEYGPRP